MLSALLRRVARVLVDAAAEPEPEALTFVVVVEGHAFYPLPLFEGRVRMVRPDSEAALDALNNLGERYDVAFSQ